MRELELITFAEKASLERPDPIANRAGIFFAYFFGHELQFISHSYFYGAVLGYLSLWIINFCFKKIKGKDGIGGGDFVLFAGIGSISGILSLAPILLIGTISSLFLYVSKPKMFSKQMPLGSCLIFGFLTYIFFNITELF